MSEQWSSEMLKQWETVIKGVAAKEQKIEHLKELCARAADALEDWCSVIADPFDDEPAKELKALIAQLRKAAQ